MMDYTAHSFVDKLIKATICVAILMMIAFVVFFRSFYAVGFVLGVGVALALNIAKIVLLKNSVDRATNMEQKAAGAYIGLQSLFRLALTVLVVTAVHFLPVVEVLGAIIGLLALPFANHVVHFTNGKYKPIDSSTGSQEENHQEEERLS